MADSTGLGRRAALRVATAGDARLVSQLGARLFAQAFGSDNSSENIEAYVGGAFSVAQQTAELADEARVTWIAQDAGGAAVGYAMVCRGQTGNGVAGSLQAQVQRVYVDEAWHRQGVGEMLINACIDQARTWHCDVLWLAVWDKNAGAIAFYMKMGFASAGVETFMLGADPQNDIVMARPIG